MDANKNTVAVNHWLELPNIPYEFTSRYNRLPSRILVRQCYKDIYEQVTAQMLNGKIFFPAFLFTGVPGIGKSIFLIYFLCRYILDDRFPDKRFALEFERGVYYYFVPRRVATVYDLYLYKHDKFNQDDFPTQEVMVLSDIVQYSEPQTLTLSDTSRR